MKIIFFLLCIFGSFTYCFGSGCPGGWDSNGNYCVANNLNSKPIIEKNGSCPSGWHSDRNYCVKN